MVIANKTLVRDGLRELRRRLPPGWTAGEPFREETAPTVEISAPDRRIGALTVDARVRLDPKGVRPIVEALAGGPRAPSSHLVVARYLTEGTRMRLREGGLSYLDLTGNARIVLDKPGLFIETQGATEDPNREERPARSLRGAKAGRVVRALIEHAQPLGVRELAALTKIDAGYISRILSFLDTESLITRVGRGRIASVDWVELLRRWGRDAPILSRASRHVFLEPRGLPTLLTKLAASNEHYALTASHVANKLAPVAPTRLAIVWMEDAVAAAERLRLYPADVGGNVFLLEPADESPFDGATQQENLWYTSPVQAVLDLFDSPGRGPQEGEALISWMQANEEKWRR